MVRYAYGTTGIATLRVCPRKHMRKQSSATAPCTHALLSEHAMHAQHASISVWHEQVHCTLHANCMQA